MLKKKPLKKLIKKKIHSLKKTIVQKSAIKKRKYTKKQAPKNTDDVVAPVDGAVVLVEEKKKRKPSFEKMYFTKDTEDAIIAFNKEENMDIRNQIYETKIKFPFEKLVENVFNTFKFSYFDVGPLDVQKETLSHLVANIQKFEEGKGKAFSYFSIIAKNYLIFNNNSNYKRFNQQVDISEENEENTVRLQSEDSHHKSVENREFVDMMINYWDLNLTDIFSKKRDLQIAEAVVELFRNIDRIDHFNKKALYLYIREISDCKTQHITKIINKMKDYQQKITKKYVAEGVI
jgi:hypothetical protein